MKFCSKNGFLIKVHNKDLNDKGSFTFPKKMTTIGYYAFKNCSNLKSLIIPAGGREIGDYAFKGCSNLKTLIILAEVTAIGEGAFSGCTSLERLIIFPGMTAIGDDAFDGCSNLKTLIILAEVTAIGDCAFSGCTSLERLIIPPGVIVIGDDAFKGCSNLNTLIIHAEVTAIGKGAFSGCSSLKSLIISGGVTAIGSWVFKGCSSLESLIIPARVTTIDSWAFEGCSSLKRLTIPAGVAAIGDGTFTDCSSLKRIIIPEGMMTIGRWAFHNCSSLERLIIPAGVAAIDDYAFAYCSSLKTLILPEALTSWGANVLEGCTQLETIVIASTDAAQIARINALLPADVQTKVMSQQVWNLKNQHLKMVERTALAPVLYAFFSLDARTVYKQRGDQNQPVKFPTLPNDVLANINEYLGADKNPYYQRAQEAIDKLPLPNNDAQLATYTQQVEQIEKDATQRVHDFQHRLKLSNKIHGFLKESMAAAQTVLTNAHEEPDIKLQKNAQKSYFDTQLNSLELPELEYLLSLMLAVQSGNKKNSDYFAIVRQEQGLFHQLFGDGNTKIWRVIVQEVKAALIRCLQGQDLPIHDNKKIVPAEQYQTYHRLLGTPEDGIPWCWWGKTNSLKFFERVFDKSIDSETLLAPSDNGARPE